MRLFVGVTPDDAALAAAEHAARELQRRLAGRLTARWVSAGNMHLTVRFIGHIEEASAPNVIDALRPALPIAPFDVQFDRCGAFPPKGPPRVIWIGLALGLPSLKAMHQEFNRRLAPLGFEPDQREFSAHLTLARVKEASRSSSTHVREVLDAVRPDPVRFTVTSATLFQSRLSPNGAVYRPLLDVSCAG